MMNNSIANEIGVVIPTCGIRDYLWETLESVNKARSKCAPGEVIVCVNAGANSEGVAETIRERVGDWARVVISDKKNQISLFPNWNFCVAQISKPYVHLLHDDDMVLPYFYDAMADLIAKYPGGSLYTCGTLVLGSSSHYNPGPSPEGLWEKSVDRLSKGNHLVNPAIVFRKDHFEDFDVKWNAVADWEAWYKLALKGPIYCTPQMLACYRVHDGSATTSLEKSGENVREVRKLLQILQGPRGCVDYTFAACIGYRAALKAARNGNIPIACKQAGLAIQNKIMPRSLARILYASLKYAVNLSRGLRA